MTTFIPSVRRIAPPGVIRAAVRALPLLAVAAVVGGVTPAAESLSRAAGRPAAATRTVVDHAVQPAGGACRQCGPAGCRHGHHRDCRDGACVPSCPVRPGTFGFYGTQWRRWPGSGVVPASNQEEVTPVKPPRSAVPGADEESFGPKASELPEPDFPARDGRGRGAADAPEPDAPSPDATSPDATTPAATPEATTQPADEQPPMPREDVRPEAAPAKPRTADENLFDDSAARRVRRKIPVTISPLPAQRSSASRVQPAAHSEPAAADRGRPAMQPVPRGPVTSARTAGGTMPRQPVR